MARLFSGIADQLDDIQPGILLFEPYEKTGDERYKIALDTLLPVIYNFPKNQEGGFWHKDRYPNQMWLDGLYMAGPLSVEYGAKFNHPEYFDLSTQQALLMEKFTKDEKTGLWYHAWDCSKEADWADPVTGKSPEFWGRSIGWVPIAMLDELIYLPEDHKDRKEIIRLTVDLLKALLPYQDEETGLWYQVVDKGDQEGNWVESSCTCLYSAAIARAIKMGFMDEKYMDVAIKGYHGIIDRLRYNEQGIIVDNICVGTGVGDYAHYCARPTSENDLHGMGALSDHVYRFGGRIGLIRESKRGCRVCGSLFQKESRCIRTEKERNGGKATSTRIRPRAMEKCRPRRHRDDIRKRGTIFWRLRITGI